MSRNRLVANGDNLFEALVDCNICWAKLLTAKKDDKRNEKMSTTNVKQSRRYLQISFDAAWKWNCICLDTISLALCQAVCMMTFHNATVRSNAKSHLSVVTSIFSVGCAKQMGAQQTMNERLEATKRCFYLVKWNLHWIGHRLRSAVFCLWLRVFFYVRFYYWLLALYMRRITRY